MLEWNTEQLVAADKRCIWHPFTAMADWCAPEHEPLVLVEGNGAILKDSRGREYIDGNSSIWTNIHGHNHPHINAALRRQLERVAHTSFLGFTNPAAIELAETIIGLVPPRTLSRVFYTDDGSTGMEAALRIVCQYWRLRGSDRKTFISFAGGYHGDTAGAAALGAATMFQDRMFRWSFPTQQVGSIAELESWDDGVGAAAVVIEPMVQGAAGIQVWPPGTLSRVREWCTRSGTLLIADEVLTGFGRTGKMFASEHETAWPDLMVLGKGLTGGYLPLSITLISEQIFEAFRSNPADEGTLFYGHSYAANPLGCAVALATLEVFVRDRILDQLQPKIALFADELEQLRQLPGVDEVRRCGFMAAIELASDFKFASRPMQRTAAAAVCIAARKYGLLTRPIRNAVVLMPPLCITSEQLKQAFAAVRLAIAEIAE